MTSRPSRRSKSSGSVPQGSPLKSIRLTVTLFGPKSDELGRLAAEKGLQVEEREGELSFAFTAPTAEEALERLRVLGGLLAAKG